MNTSDQENHGQLHYVGFSTVHYDGASVKGRKELYKKNSPPFFQKNSRKKIQAFFLHRFSKKQQKKSSFFSPPFFQKTAEKNQAFFLHRFSKNSRKKNIFFSAVHTCTIVVHTNYFHLNKEITCWAMSGYNVATRVKPAKRINSYAP